MPSWKLQRWETSDLTDFGKRSTQQDQQHSAALQDNLAIARGGVTARPCPGSRMSQSLSWHRIAPNATGGPTSAPSACQGHQMAQWAPDRRGDSARCGTAPGATTEVHRSAQRCTQNACGGAQCQLRCAHESGTSCRVEGMSTLWQMLKNIKERRHFPQN